MKTLVMVLVLLIAGCTTSTSGPAPSPAPSVPVVAVRGDADRAPMTPIHGRPLTGRTGLRVVIAQEKGGLLLDLDRGTTTTVPTPRPQPGAPFTLVADGEPPVRVVRLTDVRAGTVRRVTLPSSPGSFSDGITSPDGRWIVVRMGDPAWPGPRQLLDLWLLDTRTLRWQHVPSMPAPVSLKQTGLAWAHDGRLVILGRFDATPDVSIDRTNDVLAVWRPGETQLSVRSVRLPEQGASQFLVR